MKHWGIIWRVNRTWRFGRLKVSFKWRSKKSPLGRFGGGWDWEVGIQANGALTSWIISLLFCYVRIYLVPKEEDR